MGPHALFNGYFCITPIRSASKTTISFCISHKLCKFILICINDSAKLALIFKVLSIMVSSLTGGTLCPGRPHTLFHHLPGSAFPCE